MSDSLSADGSSRRDPGPLSGRAALFDEVVAALSCWLPHAAAGRLAGFVSGGVLHARRDCFALLPAVGRPGSAGRPGAPTGGVPAGRVSAVELDLGELLAWPRHCPVCALEFRPGGPRAVWAGREFGPLLRLWRSWRVGCDASRGRALMALTATGQVPVADADTAARAALDERSLDAAEVPWCDWSGSWRLLRRDLWWLGADPAAARAALDAAVVPGGLLLPERPGLVGLTSSRHTVELPPAGVGGDVVPVFATLLADGGGLAFVDVLELWRVAAGV